MTEYSTYAEQFHDTLLSSITRWKEKLEYTRDNGGLRPWEVEMLVDAENLLAISKTVAPATPQKGYNGWANYETWSVALLIDNEQGSQDYWRERALEMRRSAEPTEVLDKAAAARYNLTDALKEEHDENNPLAGTGTVYEQLLGGALSEVYWDEIARNMLDGLESDVDIEVARLRRDYSVNEDGVITSPGKYEGEPLFVAYLDGLAGEGLADEETIDEDEVDVEDDNDDFGGEYNGPTYYHFDVDDELRWAFPDLKDVARVTIWQGETGFVYHSTTPVSL